MDGGKIVADGDLEETLEEKFDLLEGLGVGVPRVSLLWTMLRRDGLVSGKFPTHVKSTAAFLGGTMNQCVHSTKSTILIAREKEPVHISHLTLTAASCS